MLILGLLFLRTNPINQGLRHRGEYRGRALHKYPQEVQPQCHTAPDPDPIQDSSYLSCPALSSPVSQNLYSLTPGLTWPGLNHHSSFSCSIENRHWSKVALHPCTTAPIIIFPLLISRHSCELQCVKADFHLHDYNKKILTSQPKLQEPGI